MFDSAYSLKTIRERGLEHSVTSRDLEGFFDHVWSVNPLLGADAADLGPGRRMITDLADRHTVIEAPIGRFRMFRRLRLLNFAFAQGGLFIALNRMIKRKQISVIRAGDPLYQGLLGLALARLNSIPLLIRVNGNYDAIYAATGRLAYPQLLRYRWLEKRIARFVFARADFVAAANADNLAYALANKAPRGRTAIFRYGNLIDPAHFSSPRERDPVLHEVGVPRTSSTIIFVGRLERVKHPEDVLESLADVDIEKSPLAVLVGEGSMREELEAKAHEKGIRDRVFFVGARDQKWLANAFAEAAVVVCPMSGRSLVEAALSGSPIVAYDVEWHSEIITQGETGMLVPYRDARAIASAINLLLEVTALAATLGSAARQRALEMMDPTTLTAVERATYERLFLKAPGNPSAS